MELLLRFSALIAVMTVLTCANFFGRRPRDTNLGDLVTPYDGPPIEDLVHSVKLAKLKINDIKLRAEVDEACRNTLQFFDDVAQADPDNLEGFQKEYAKHLADLKRLIEAFGRAEKDHRTDVLQQTREGIHGYSTYVRSSIDRIGTSDMIPFQVISQQLASLKYL